MSCDIHLHQEVMIDGQWEHYALHRVESNYMVFGLMAGVRGRATPVVPPKGLPNDVTKVTAEDYCNWRADAHTMSWLDKSEIGRLYAEVEKYMKGTYEYPWPSEYFGYCFGNNWNTTPYEVRFIFWFDN